MLRRLLAWAAKRWLPSRRSHITSVARARQMIAQALEAFEKLNDRARPVGSPQDRAYFSAAKDVAELWGKYTGMSDPCVRYGAAHTLKVIREYQDRGETTLMLHSVGHFLPDKNTTDRARIDRLDYVQDPICFDVCMIVWRTIDEEYSDHPAYLFLHDCSSEHWHQVMGVVLDLVDLILARRVTRTTERFCRRTPPNGARVTTRSKIHGIERYPHFTAPVDITGTVEWWDKDGDGFAVKVDQPVEGAEEWDNEITYPERGYGAPMFWDEWVLMEEAA